MHIQKMLYSSTNLNQCFHLAENTRVDQAISPRPDRPMQKKLQKNPGATS